MLRASARSRSSKLSNLLLSRISFLSVEFILSAIAFSFGSPHSVMLMPIRALLNFSTYSLLAYWTPLSEWCTKPPLQISTPRSLAILKAIDNACSAGLLLKSLPNRQPITSWLYASVIKDK